MIPILLLQLCYKALWFPLAYFPLRAAGRSSDLGPGFLVAIALDLIVIPWPYVLENYLKKPGDRWKPESAEGRIRQVPPGRNYLALAALLTIFTSSVTS